MLVLASKYFIKKVIFFEKQFQIKVFKKYKEYSENIEIVYKASLHIKAVLVLFV